MDKIIVFIILASGPLTDFIIIREKCLKAIRGFYDCDLIKGNYNLVR